MTDPIYDADLLWLREGYLDEMPVVQWLAGESDLGLEMGGGSSNGLYRKWLGRLASDSFMGDFRRILLPVHEAVKRLGVGPERRWLRYALNWRGLPCLCAHTRITAHLAAMDGADESTVANAIRVSVRSVIAKMDAGNFDIRRRSGRVAVGRRASQFDKRGLPTTDTAPVPTNRRPRREAEDLGLTHRGSVGGSRSLEKSPGYVCRSSGQWVSSCNCPPFDLDDIRAAA